MKKTKALDLVTIFHALLELEKEFLGKDRIWNSLGEEQKHLLNLYYMYKSEVLKLADLKAKASPDWETLNAFLQENKFDPMFDSPLDGLGVVSILDKLVKWIIKGDLCTIISPKGSFPGFKLPEGSFEVYSLPRHKSPLVRIKTQSDDSLFLLMSEQNHNGVGIFDYALSCMENMGKTANSYNAIRIPKVDFDIKPDISFLVGANTRDEKKDTWFITQAKQQFKFRMNELGARAKVATGILAKRGFSPQADPDLIFDRPFYGWFVQGDSLLPMAVFYADYDSWKDPVGSLESL